MRIEIENKYKTDIYFNHGHEHPQIAHLEKWNALAQKFFRMHQADLRPKFYRNWAGSSSNDKGRFDREIKKLEQNFLRKCSNDDMAQRQDGIEEAKPDAEYFIGPASEERTRRAEIQLKEARNPGRRMKHIVHNVEKWVEDYLTGCSNQQKVVDRWQKFAANWEREIARNPIFQEEFKQEEKYLRNYDGPGRPCGRIYREFGLHGQYMELYDASLDEENGFDDLDKTDFGSYHLMSMQPFEGKTYITIIPTKTRPFRAPSIFFSRTGVFDIIFRLLYSCLSVLGEKRLFIYL